jgi:hypothetical protein
VLALSFFLIIFPVFIERLSNKKSESMKKNVLNSPRKGHRQLFFIFAYFASIGLGFMFIEVTLIHKSMLVLENPSYAFTTVLTAILISSGAGSLFSTKLKHSTIYYMILILAGLILTYSFAFSFLLEYISHYQYWLKSTIIFLSLLPAGFFMGIPFPSAIKFIGSSKHELIPWAWSVNGFMSVLAPVLTILIAVAIGYRFVLILGALSYINAFLTFKGIFKTNRDT